MVDEPQVDDPFERAARREREAEATGRARDQIGRGMVHSALMMVGIALGWAVLVGIHAGLAGTDGLLFRVHLVLFGLWSAFTIMLCFMSFAMRTFR